MVFPLLVSVVFQRPLTFIIAVGGVGGWGGIKMASVKTQSANEPARPHFSLHSTAITNDKSTNLRKNGIYWYKWCCDRFSKLLLLLLWINCKKRRFLAGARNWLPLWNWGQKSDGRLQIWCSIQVSLHREPPEVRLVTNITRCLYWWVKQHVPTLHRECYHTLWYMYIKKKAFKINAKIEDVGLNEN